MRRLNDYVVYTIAPGTNTIDNPAGTRRRGNVMTLYRRRDVAQTPCDWCCINVNWMLHKREVC